MLFEVKNLTLGYENEKIIKKIELLFKKKE